MLKLRVLLSGATGFVGGKVLRSLDAFNVNVMGRSKPELVNSDNFFQSKINSSTDYSIALNRGCKSCS